MPIIDLRHFLDESDERVRERLDIIELAACHDFSVCHCSFIDDIRAGVSKISPDWSSTVGKPNTAVNWPAGLGAKGNDGVAGQIKQQKGALGYVELIYAVKNNLPYGKVKNKSGQFVKADLKSVTAAAGAMKAMPALRHNALLVRDSVGALDSKDYRLARAVILVRIGAAAIPDVRRLAKTSKSPRTRARAARLAQQLAHSRRR